jgi:phosphoglycolate phosphatase
MRRYQVVLFDLDGTLADTAGDLGYALNLQRVRRKLEEIPLDRVRPHASAGARGLLRLGFGIDTEHPDYEQMRSEFLDLYAANLHRTTALFPGVAQTLSELERRSVRWGIVTNKPSRFTLPLVAALGLNGRSACVVCGDMVGAPKPHPAALLEAAARLAVTPESCVYVGDDERDVVAAHAAGMESVIALYGYLGSGTPPAAWGASAVIASPLDLISLPGLAGHPSDKIGSGR